VLSFALLSMLACTGEPSPVFVPPDDTASPTDPPGPAPGAPGFLTGELCLVRTIFETTCVTGCHSAAVPGGGLDLQTDPHAALVDRPSSSPGAPPLVVPGDAVGSFLFLKMAALQSPDQGDVMPPEGRLGAVPQDVVRAWIENGAADDCNLAPPGGDAPPPPPPPVTPPPPPEPGEPTPAPYHPPGWSAADQHGVAANLQTDGDCRSCHGAQLDGGTANQSCDSCHDPGWRTDCTMCHGGTANQSGAPPKDVDGIDNPNLISFTSHTAHIEHGYGCSQCHYSPADYLTNGHVFGDVTPGFGEIDYSAGISAVATYSNGTCSNAYCHGNGRADNGVVNDAQGPLGCTACHPNAGSDPNDWAQMSGLHALHLNVTDVVCYDCHANTVDATNAIVAPNLHVNGTKDLQSNDIQVGATCTGACHGYNHAGAGW
jgi:predicted CxxxxCH...CXXCH cytochrome family protein